MTDSRAMAALAAAAAEEKKAQNVVALDMSGVSLIADYFVICSGRTATQVQAIADNVEKEFKAAGMHFLHREGYREGKWLLLDYGAVVVHIFQEDQRSFYNLERLWGDAALVNLSEDKPQRMGAQVL